MFFDDHICGVNCFPVLVLIITGADLSETQKTDKDGFMEVPEGEIPFD